MKRPRATAKLTKREVSAKVSSAMSRTNRTGHTEMLRRRLRARREELKLSQQDVADRIAAALGEPHRAATSVTNYEAMTRQPKINVFAAWARAVGLRLVVDLDDAESTRVPVLVQPDRAELAKALDVLDESDLAIVRGVIERLLG